MSFNTWTLIFIGISVGVFLLLLLVLLIGKKNKVSGFKKFLTVLLTIFFVGSCTLTAMVNFNIVPLGLHVGYFLEVSDLNGDGRIAGFKFSSEMHATYYTQMNLDNPRDSGSEYQGKYHLDGKKLLIFDNHENLVGTYEVSNFGKELYKDGQLVYQYFHDIEMGRY